MDDVKGEEKHELQSQGVSSQSGIIPPVAPPPPPPQQSPPWSQQPQALKGPAVLEPKKYETRGELQPEQQQIPPKLPPLLRRPTLNIKSQWWSTSGNHSPYCEGFWSMHPVVPQRLALAAVRLTT